MKCSPRSNCSLNLESRSSKTCSACSVGTTQGVQRNNSGTLLAIASASSGASLTCQRRNSRRSVRICSDGVFIGRSYLQHSCNERKPFHTEDTGDTEELLASVSSVASV